MAFWSTFTLIDWVIVLLIVLLLLVIVRNVCRLMKRRNEYISYKEAQEQYAWEHNGRGPEKTIKEETNPEKTIPEEMKKTAAEDAESENDQT
ncbi:MAG: hypothetical protein LBU81_01380 [Methanosarcinales archaeon]|jgi:flagellar biosynthesis/type III secretory pathway M-ring protein FliF/YscJ|nr:hypothetical protein [Methanosarcinales archaeon]